MPTFLVRYIAKSGARFSREQPGISLTYAGASAGPVAVQAFTYSDDPAGDVPRGLLVVASTTADTLDEAIATSTPVVQHLTSVVGMTANAPVGEPDVFQVYDVTADATRRAYRERFIPAPATLPTNSRSVDVAALLEVLAKLDAHPDAHDAEYLFRAINHYQLSLPYFRFGTEIMAVSHLWMVVEALTPVATRQYCDAEQIQRNDLKDRWGLKDPRLISAEVRKRLVFRGDKDCYDAAHRVRHGYEHAFAEAAALRSLAVKYRDQVAGCVRRSLLELLHLSTGVRDLLLSPRYATPLQWWEPYYVVDGFVVGDAEAFAAHQGQLPPLLWDINTTPAGRSAEGRHEARDQVAIRSQLPAGLHFEQTVLRRFNPVLAATSAEDLVVDEAAQPPPGAESAEQPQSDP